MHGMKKILILMLSTAMPASTLSQPIGDAQKGLQYASEVCAKCHAVHLKQPASPLPQAPRFEDIANTPGMTAIALTTWFQTSHPTMPNLIIKNDEMRNVIQYILSLKRE
jgi:mono/diheme cytochrome c family protein